MKIVKFVKSLWIKDKNGNGIPDDEEVSIDEIERVLDEEEDERRRLQDMELYEIMHEAVLEDMNRSFADEIESVKNQATEDLNHIIEEQRRLIQFHDDIITGKIEKEHIEIVQLAMSDGRRQIVDVINGFKVNRKISAVPASTYFGPTYETSRLNKSVYLEYVK